MKIKVVSKHGDWGEIDLIGPVVVRKGHSKGQQVLHDETTETDYFFNTADGTFDGTGHAVCWEPKEEQDAMQGT